MFNIQLIKDEFPEEHNLKINHRVAVRGLIRYEDKLLMVRTSLGDYKFPGGGISKYEDDKMTLLREIREETGFIDITVGPCVGTAFEQNLDNFADNAMFQMESRYYLCQLNSLEQVDQVLEDYEQEMEFTGCFVSIHEAYDSNNAILTERSTEMIPDIGMPVSDWVARETAVLKHLDESLVDCLLWDIYECGQLMKNADRSSVSIDGKEGHANFVTNYDKQIQKELYRRLLAIYPGAEFVGEEDGDGDSSSVSDRTGFTFIVDPIDGTTNFMKDYQTSCISVGLAHNGEQVGGIVYQPYLDEMFCAQKGQGAFLNGKRIHVSNANLENALVVFGTAPYYEELTDKSFAKAREVIRHCIDVRRSGSAALDLCSVAAGRADMYFEYRICPWDIAAGSLIVTEAGGTVSTIEGGQITLEDKCSILATNGVTYLPE